jgi:hypothetical protein
MVIFYVLIVVAGLILLGLYLAELLSFRIEDDYYFRQEEKHKSDSRVP